MKRNIDFYQDVLKFEVLNRSEVAGRLIWALLKIDEVEFIVMCAEPSDHDDRDLLVYFQKEDAAIVQTAVQSAGYSLQAFQEAIYEPGYNLFHPQKEAAAA